MKILFKKLKYTVLCFPLMTLFLSQALAEQSSWPQKEVSCPHCHWSLPQSAQEAAVQPGLLCENLYQAACLVADGAKKDRDRAKEIETALKATVEEARQKTYTQLGFQNTEHALTQLFSKNAIVLVENLSEKAKKSLFQNDTSVYVPPKEIFQTVAQCQTQRDSFPGTASNQLDDVQRQLTDIESFLRAYQFQRNQLLARNLPALIKILNDKCRNLENRTLSENQSTELAPLILFCSQRDQARQAVLQLERGVNGKDHSAEQALAIVEYFSPLLNLNEQASAASQTSVSAGATSASLELEALRSRYHFLLRHSSSTCEGLATEISNRSKRIREDFLKVISRSRPTVEFLISHHYDDEKKQLAHALFDRARQEVIQILQRIVPNPLVRNRIEEQYSKLEMAWLQFPASAEYERHPEWNVEVLKRSREMSLSSISGAFHDADLSFFTTMNATYMTSLQLGAIRSAATVTMMPSFLRMLQRNPYGFMTVLSHEIGHKIGPQLSIVNGNDLSEVHRPLTSCLARTDSIGMTVDQADESVSDAIAAEILAKLVAQMPESMQTRAIIAAVEPFCAIADGNRMGTIDMRRVHPEGIFRVGGIFGTNPGIRNLLSCKAESRTYKTCSWGQ